jgi:hypothetical protein
MKRIKIEPTKHSPSVLLDPDNNTVSFEGFSLPEDAMDFYLPIITWFHEFKSICEEKIFNKCSLNVSFRLSYYNTASHRAFLEIFNIMKLMKEKGLIIRIEWYYEKDDVSMLENGKELSEMANMDLNFTELG